MFYSPPEGRPRRLSVDNVHHNQLPPTAPSSSSRPPPNGGGRPPREDSSRFVQQKIGRISQDSITATNGDSQTSFTGKNGVCMDDFKFIKAIGEGVFGKVVLVEGPDQGLYAMKLLSKRQYEAQRVVQKAYSEKHLLKTCNNCEYLVRLIWAFQNPTHWALVMEYCPNGNLAEYILSLGTLQMNDAQRKSWEMLMGLEYLHQRKVLFRDLKPENVILDKHWRCKLTDFGLAKEDVGYRAGGAFTICGSHGYVAPEIMHRYTSKLRKGQGASYGLAADMYSFGVTVFVMVTGGERQQDANTGTVRLLPPEDDEALVFFLRRAFEPGHVVVDFILKLIHHNPRERLTVTQAKYHQFFPLETLL